MYGAVLAALPLHCPANRSAACPFSCLFRYCQCGIVIEQFVDGCCLLCGCKSEQRAVSEANGDVNRGVDVGLLTPWPSLIGKPRSASRSELPGTLADNSTPLPVTNDISQPHNTTTSITTAIMKETMAAPPPPPQWVIDLNTPPASKPNRSIVDPPGFVASTGGKDKVRQPRLLAALTYIPTISQLLIGSSLVLYTN